MSLMTLTLATAITGGTVVCAPHPRTSTFNPDVWVLPSENIRLARQIIVLSVAEYQMTPALDAVMRSAHMSSTDYRYDI
jgi:hypothetical protein